MTEFLKIDLEGYSQPANVRLRDECESELVITQAHFNRTGATIIRLRANKKARQFGLSPDEMDALTDAWMDYRGRVIVHNAEQEARKEQVIAKARALAKSVQFDLESLNVRIYHDDSDNSWAVEIPAIEQTRWIFEKNDEIKNLSKEVEYAFKRLKEKVELAERNNWIAPWPEIIASYRRVFPLNAEQGEPAEITEARRLLTEAGIENWTLTPCSKGMWGFFGPFGNEGEVYMPDESPAQLLADIKEYLERKKSDAILDAMENKGYSNATTYPSGS